MVRCQSFLITWGECIVAREDHADGGTHLHAFVAFERKFRSRRTDIFDVDGCNANIVPSRGNPGGGYDYAIKHGEVVAGGLERPSGGGVSKTSTPWHWIISAASPGELRELVRELAPKEAILRHREIESFIASEFAEERPPYVHPCGFEFELGMVPELDAWGRNLAATVGSEGTLFVCDGPNRSCLGVFCGFELNTARRVPSHRWGDLRPPQRGTLA